MNKASRLLGWALLGVALWATPQPLAASQAQRDLLERRMAEAIMAEDYSGFLVHLADFIELGGTEVPEMIYYEAVAWERQGDLNGANTSIQTFLAMVDRNHRLYGDALALADSVANRLAASGNRHMELDQIVSMDGQPDVGALYDFARRHWGTTESLLAADYLREIEQPLITKTPTMHRALAAGLEWSDRSGLLAMSPDGKRVGAIDTSGNVHIWFIDSGLVQWQWTTPASAPGRYTIAFSPNPNVFAIGLTDGTVQLWNLQTGQLISKINITSPGGFNAVTSLSFSGNGSRLAAILQDNTVQVHDLAANRELWRFTHKAGTFPKDVALSPDGRLLITVGLYHAEVWDIDRRATLYGELQADGAFAGAAWSPDGKTFAIADRNGAQLRDGASGRIIGTAIGHEADPGRSPSQWIIIPQIERVGFSQTGRFFTVGGRKTTIANTDTTDGSVYVYEADGRLVSILTGHGDNGCTAHQQWVCRKINGAVISPDGQTMVTTGYDGFMRIWRLP